METIARFTLNTTPQLFEEWLKWNAPIPELSYPVGELTKHTLPQWQRAKGYRHRLVVQQVYSQTRADGVEEFLPAPVTYCAFLGEDGEPVGGWQPIPPDDPMMTVEAAGLTIDNIGGGRIAVTATCREKRLCDWFDELLALIAATYPEAGLTQRGAAGIVSTADRLPGGANLDDAYNAAYQREQELIAQGKTRKEARMTAFREYCARTDKDYSDKNARDAYRAAMKLRERKKRS